MLFMPVRHCCPFASAKRNAMLRIGTLLSGAYGLLPGIAKRPTTGVRPGANTCAAEYVCAWPLLSKWPVTHTPLAWLRR